MGYFKKQLHAQEPEIPISGIEKLPDFPPLEGEEISVSYRIMPGDIADLYVKRSYEIVHRIRCSDRSRIHTTSMRGQTINNEIILRTLYGRGEAVGKAATA